MIKHDKKILDKRLLLTQKSLLEVECGPRLGLLKMD